MTRAATCEFAQILFDCAAKLYVDIDALFNEQYAKMTITDKANSLLKGAAFDALNAEQTTSRLEFISKAKRTALSTWPLILLGDLNVNLQHLWSNQGTLNRRTKPLALVTTLGLQDLHHHFWQSQWKYVGDWTRNMRREGTHIYSKCDYILTTEHSHFSNFSILMPRFDTDH